VNSSQHPTSQEGLKRIRKAWSADAQTLDLSGLRLTALPAEVGRLTNLQTLYLSDNQLTALPAELGQLTNLELLNLSGNQMTALPAWLGQLTNLQRLELSRNQLTALPTELGQLTNLRELELSGNQLTWLPAELGQLTNLQRLDLSDNQLTALPALLGRLTRLQMLDLRFNRLTVLPAELGQLTNLRWLHLQLTTLPAWLGQLTNLELLDLSGNQLTALPAELGQLTNLRELDLSDNQLTALPAWLGQLTNLRELDLSGNPLAELLPGLATLLGIDAVRAYLRRLHDIRQPSSGPEGADLAEERHAARGPTWKPEQEMVARPARFVNVIVAESGTIDSVPLDQPLEPGARYDILVNIGMFRPDSLLPPLDGTWPQDELPQGNLRLRAVLRMDGWSSPVVIAFTLPRRGESFTCDCPEDGGHGVACRHDAWARFPVTTSYRSRRWTGELAIYYQAVVVHAQRLFLPIGTRALGGPRAQLLYRLTTSFANLGELADRTASILVSASGSRIMVNGVSFVDDPVSIRTEAVDQAARSARDILYDIHLRAAGGRVVSRYDAHHGKPQAAFEADLRLLARAGAEIYEALFPDSRTWRTLPGLLRHEAWARGRPAVLCIAEAGSTGRSDRHIPWSIVYDLPVGADPSTYKVCPSMRRFGPEGKDEAVPAHCPIDHAEEDDVLCPFGFWGLACLIEQPPSANYDLTQVVTHASDPGPVSLLVVTDPDLDATITQKHVANLRSHLRGTIDYPAIANSHDLALALGPEEIDVAYLYCHCGYQKLSDRAAPSVFLRLGSQSIGPLDVSKWARSARLWPHPHWPNRKPLVVLNGCHTVEFTSATLSDFVSAFVNRAGAAGVVGTEVAVEQHLASFLMELFLTNLAAGTAAGDALRDARWRLVRRGNIMGLGYTPYCLSGLRLRPAI